MNAVEQFLQVMAELARSYEVPDLVLPSADLIFILESPHIQELKYRAPVSGASGATMTKHLFGPAYARFPLGILVKKNAEEQKNRPRLNRIGLINVCNIPMQASAYRHPHVHQTYRPWLEALEYIRAANHRDTVTDALHQAVQTVLTEHLRAKLLSLVPRRCTLVPCGRFAQKFFRLANVHSDHWQVIHGVPHPSYNSWDRPQYAGVVRQVVMVLNGQGASAPPTG
ncbi:MAG: hypothetical protein K6T31_07625 [Alicyclobacillus sp.]|nr:hypothetical protein [Alicyclobacillus sp.]